MTSTEIILACFHPIQDGRCPAEVTLADGRQVACCVDCWNQSVYARRAEDKARIEVAKSKGREYWSSRGIAVGDVLFCCGVGIFGPYRIAGIAKVGKCGAYVVSKTQRGQLHPAAFISAVKANGVQS